MDCRCPGCPGCAYYRRDGTRRQGNRIRAHRHDYIRPQDRRCQYCVEHAAREPAAGHAARDGGASIVLDTQHVNQLQDVLNELADRVDENRDLRERVNELADRVNEMADRVNEVYDLVIEIRGWRGFQ